MLMARKRDDNEKPIVQALQALGAVVTRLNDFGVPDLLVGYRGRTILLEVKNPDGGNQKSKRSKATKLAKGTAGPIENAKGQLTPTQVDWWGKWIGGEAHVVETPEQAVAIVRGAAPPSSVGVSAGAADSIPGSVAMYLAATKLTVRMPPEEADALAGALHEQAGVARSRRCALPPLGWSCTRDRGHDGPCAARPTIGGGHG